MKEKVKEKIQIILTNKYTYFAIFMILMICLNANQFAYKINRPLTNKLCIAFIIGAIMLTITSMVLLILTEKKKCKIETIFVILGAFLGISYLVAAPLFTGSDEHNHYYRIYEITEGVIITPVQENNTIGGQMPSSLYKTFVNNAENEINRNQRIKYKDEIDMAKQPLNETETMQYGETYATQYCNTSLYNPLQYIPQIIGFMIGKIFNAGPFWLGQLGRLFNLIVYLLIGTYFLKKSSGFKELAVLTLLSPTLLSNATTLSADAFTNILIFGLVTLIVNCRKAETKISTKELILLGVISVLIASCKIVYLPFVVMLLLIPNEAFKSKKQKMIFCFGIILISTIINVVWMQITDRFFDAYYLNTETQKNNILHNLIGYFFVVLRTYMDKFSMLLLNVFGSTDMYHAQLPVYGFLSVVYLAIVSYAAIKNWNKNEKKENIWYYIIVSVLLLGVLALITTAIYIQCTANFVEINHPMVVGLQGRYYIPFILSIPLLLKGSASDKTNHMVLGIGVLTNISVIFQMLVCFIG